MICLPVFAQENKNPKAFSYGIYTSSCLSFAGYSAAAGGYVMGRKSMLMLGFNTSLPDLIYHRNLRKGMQVAYRFYAQERTGKLSLHMGPVIQMTHNKKYDNNTGAGRTLLTEAFMEYGLDWMVLPRLSLGNTVGFGVFYEDYDATVQNDDGIVHGLNARASINLIFRINK